MSKSINKKQSETLLSRMQEKPDIARGFVKESRVKVAKFWKQLNLELNSAGPPVKSEFEWKKVWTDQKRYVRNKAASNKIQQKGTGGGPNKTQKLSPSEEAIYQLIGTKEAVEGVETSQSFGIPPPEKRRREENKNICDELVEAPIEDAPNQNNIADTEITSATLNTRSRKADKLSTNDVVLEELEVQKKLCSKVFEAVSVMKDHNKEIQNSLKKLHRSMDRLTDLKKEQLSEDKRHNLEMENFRKTELENKGEKIRKMLELEELKISIIKGQNSDGLFS